MNCLPPPATDLAFALTACLYRETFHDWQFRTGTLEVGCLVRRYQSDAPAGEIRRTLRSLAGRGYVHLAQSGTGQFATLLPKGRNWIRGASARDQRRGRNR
jgi:hypothetical protein